MSTTWLLCLVADGFPKHAEAWSPERFISKVTTEMYDGRWFYLICVVTGKRYVYQLDVTPCSSGVCMSHVLLNVDAGKHRHGAYLEMFSKSPLSSSGHMADSLRTRRPSDLRLAR